MNNKVNVVIGGEIITLRSAEQPDYLQRLARYADQKIDEIKSKSISASIDDRARNILIALNIADDYHKVLDKFQRLDSLYKKVVAEMGKMQDDNSGLVERVKKLEEDLEATKNDLADAVQYIESMQETQNVLTMPPTSQQRKAR